MPGTTAKTIALCPISRPVLRTASTAVASAAAGADAVLLAAAAVSCSWLFKFWLGIRTSVRTSVYYYSTLIMDFLAVRALVLVRLFGRVRPLLDNRNCGRALITAV